MNKSGLIKKALMVCFGSLIAQLSFSQSATHSFTLEEAQQYAIKNSYVSLTAQKEVEKSQHKVKETIGSGLPQINGTANYQKYLETPVQLIPGAAIGDTANEFIEVFFGTEQQMTYGATINQLIFDGSYFVGLQAARVYLELSKNDLAKSDIEVKSMVTEAYGNVLIAEHNVEILKQNVKNLEKNAFETQKLYESGFLEEQDKDQMQLNLANVKNSFNKARRMIAIARNNLKFVLGIEITSSLELKDGLEELTKVSSSASYLEKDFDVTSHIDYRIINTQEQATRLLLKQQKSTHLPSLSAFYTYQKNAFANEFNFFGDATYFPTQLIGLNLNVPIFSGFARSNRIQQAKIDFEKVGIAKKQVEQQLSIQAQNAKSNYTFALSQYNTSKENLKLAESIYNKTNIKYKEGISSSLELSQTNLQLQETQGQYINAAFELIKAKSNLDKALNQ